MLRIVHFSIKRMAGGPFRLVQALRRHTDHQVRLIDLARWDDFPHDVVFAEEPELAVELAKQADIIHFHNYLDYDSREFWPIDFQQLRRQGTAFLRHFRSHPQIVARMMNAPVERVLSCPIPSVVIAQFQERFYPQAQVVPNNIPLDDDHYLPCDEPPEWDIAFSPTNESRAWANRWNTKGAPETVRLLKRVSRRTGCTAKILTGLPLREVLHSKRRAFLLLDELVTGSYHVSGLEGISMAKPTLAFLDDRTLRVLREVAGSDTQPFVNVRLADAERVVGHLLEHRQEAEQIGHAGRQWLEAHWSEQKVARRFEDIYDNLLKNPELVRRQANLRLDANPTRFHAITLPDLVHESHIRRFQGPFSRLTVGLRRLARSCVSEPIERKATCDRAVTRAQ